MLKRSQLIIKKLIKFLVAFAGILVILSFVSYFFLADALGLDQKIPSLIANKTGLECSIGKIHVLLLPKPGLLLKDVIFLPPGSNINSYRPTFKSISQAAQENANSEDSPLKAGESNANATQQNPQLPSNSSINPKLMTSSGNGTATPAQASMIMPIHGLKAPSLYIKNLAIYLAVPSLFKGEIEPAGGSVNGLFLYLSSMDKLSELLNKSIAKITPSSSTEETPQIVVIENSKPQIIAWLWGFLKAVELSDTGVYILNKDGNIEILFDNIELHEFLGELSLSLLMHGQVNNKPYSMHIKTGFSQFEYDFNSVAFELEATANDKMGFNSRINTLVRFDEKKNLVFLNNLQINTGKTSLSSDITIEIKPDSEDLSWHAKGPATIANFDLPRWVPPLLNMSPEAQTLMGNIDSTLELELKPNGLYLNDIKAVVGPYNWTGTGSITDFTGDIKIYFDLKTNELPLEVVFPELTGPGLPPRFTQKAPSFNLPHFLSGEIGQSPKVELILGVDNLLFRSLRINGVKAIMHNFPLYVRWKMSATKLAGSKLDAVILDNDDFTIDVKGKLSGVQIEPLLTGLGWDLPIHGSASSNFSLKGKTDTLDNFLETIHLKFRGEGTNILFASSPAPATPKQRDFNRFERLNLKASFIGAPTNDNTLNARINLKAQIDGDQRKDTLNIQTKGLILFDTNGMMKMNELEIDGQMTSNLEFIGFDSKPHTSPIKGKFKCSQKNGSFELDINSLSMAGLTGTTQIKGNDIGHRPKISGNAQLKSKSLRNFLTKVGSNVSSIPAPLLREATAQANFTVHETPNGMMKARISNINAKIDYMNFKANAWYGPGDKARIEITADEIDIDAYRSPQDKTKPKPPAKPWNVTTWLNTNLNLELETPSLKFMKLGNKDVALKTTTGKGKLLASLNSTTCDGELTADFIGKDNAGLLNSVFSLRLEKANLEKITEALTGEVKAAGSLEISMDLSGNLASMDDIPKALNGQLAFNIGKGYFVRSQTQGNNKSKKNNDKEILSNFDFVKGTAIMKSGVLYTKDLLMNGQSTQMVGHGEVDLVKDKINITMELHMSGIAFPVTLEGDLAAPKIKLQGGKFVTHNIFNLLSGFFTLPLKLIELGKE